MTVTVHTVDRYDFNDGQESLGSLVPDADNGRFEVLGMAHSFNTFGEMTFDITWSEGEIITWDAEGEIFGSELVIQDGSGR